MRSRYALLTTAVCILMLLVSGLLNAQEPAETSSSDGMLIHIKSGVDNPHAVLMGLSLAVKMAEDTDVLVFFSVKGIHHVLKNAEDLQYADFKKSGELLDALEEQGVELYACPMCLRAEGYKPEDLRNGVGLMAKEQFFGFTDGRIVTLDF